jgi:hypothetical protein
MTRDEIIGGGDKVHQDFIGSIYLRQAASALVLNPERHVSTKPCYQCEEHIRPFARSETSPYQLYRSRHRDNEFPQ